MIEYYDSIEELPVKRFHKFNKYMLIDSGIGSDLNDVNEHIDKVARYIKFDTKAARTELENLRQSLYLIAEGTNVKHLSFAILIYSIDSRVMHDISDENIKRVSRMMSDSPKRLLDQLIDSVKKKIDLELNQYFPNQFQDSTTKEHYDKLKKRVLLQLHEAKTGEDSSKKVESIDNEILMDNKPKTFAGKESIEVLYDKQFEESCIYLRKELGVDIDSMSTQQFYNSIEYIEKVNKAKSKANGR